MKNKEYETNIISLKRRRLAKKYKALFNILTKIKTFFNRNVKKPIIRKNYRRTINH